MIVVFVADREPDDSQCIDVTVQIQALVKDSKLIIPDTVSKVSSVLQV